MALKRDYLGISKLYEGYGGWRCPCCNPYGTSPRRMKVRARRLARHIAKRKWQAEAHNWDGGVEPIGSSE